MRAVYLEISVEVTYLALTMIIKQVGNIVYVYEDDLETIKFQVELPEHFTTQDVEGFYKHLIKMIKERENGPS